MEEINPDCTKLEFELLEWLVYRADCTKHPLVNCSRSLLSKIESSIEVFITCTLVRRIKKSTQVTNKISQCIVYRVICIYLYKFPRSTLTCCLRMNDIHRHLSIAYPRVFSGSSSKSNRGIVQPHLKLTRSRVKSGLGLESGEEPASCEFDCAGKAKAKIFLGKQHHTIWIPGISRTSIRIDSITGIPINSWISFIPKGSWTNINWTSLISLRSIIIIPNSVPSVKWAGSFIYQDHFQQPYQKHQLNQLHY